MYFMSQESAEDLGRSYTILKQALDERAAYIDECFEKHLYDIECYNGKIFAVYIANYGTERYYLPLEVLWDKRFWEGFVAH